ncbi:Tfb4-domain-containing protein, partial [Clavulina sp. PMI_390]
MAESAALDVDGPSHLTLILDLSPKQWHLSSIPSNEHPLSLEDFLPQLLTFINAHLAARHDNSITVYGALPGTSVLLYSSEEPTPAAAVRDANVYQPFNVVDTTMTDRMKEYQKSISDSGLPIGLVGAITKGLCHLNKILNPGSSSSTEPKFDSGDHRMLVLSVSPDVSASYVPIMNAIFAAQKLKVKIDVCKVYGEDTVFLQQAAHLTGGLYVSPVRRDALLQHLVMCFLAPGTVRNALMLPTQDRVDLRAACFCHKNIVDIGYYFVHQSQSASPAGSSVAASTDSYLHDDDDDISSDREEGFTPEGALSVTTQKLGEIRSGTNIRTILPNPMDAVSRKRPASTSDAGPSQVKKRALSTTNGLPGRASPVNNDDSDTLDPPSASLENILILSTFFSFSLELPKRSHLQEDATACPRTRTV